MPVTFTCITCCRVYKYKRSLALHRKYECGKDPTFQCDVCGRKFHLFGNLTKHKKNVHLIFTKPVTGQ